MIIYEGENPLKRDLSTTEDKSKMVHSLITCLHLFASKTDLIIMGKNSQAEKIWSTKGDYMNPLYFTYSRSASIRQKKTSERGLNQLNVSNGSNPGTAVLERKTDEQTKWLRNKTPHINKCGQTCKSLNTWLRTRTYTCACPTN